MGTRSTIAIEYENGFVAQIYCHWDGYLSHNGKILLEHYTEVPKIAELINLGDLSVLDKEIGVKVDFDDPSSIPNGQCISYKRDRGDSDTGASYFNSFEEYEKDHDYQEYEYIFRQSTNTWFVNFGKDWINLKDAIDNKMDED